MRLRLGTRASLLAVTQSQGVADALTRLGHEVELVRVTTTGDRATGSLTRLEGLGVFAAELRQAILEGRCDFAVHSFKDLPVAPVEGLTIAAVPPRADSRDALCSGGPTLAELPPGAKVGTGSPRRVAQLRAIRPDLSFVDVRGNVGTRLARVAEGDLDAVVLAVAGLNRIGKPEAISELLDILPAPAQGALALECRAGDQPVLAALAALDDPATREAATAEREVLRLLGGGCAAPIAALCDGERLRAGVFALDGARQVTATANAGPGAARNAVDQLLRGGAAEAADLAATAPSRLANLHDDVSLWRGDTVLAGLKVLHPRGADSLAEALRAAGAEVVAEPVLARVPLRPEAGLEGADWVAITSPATVAALRDLGLRIPTSARIAAVGEATARALRAAGYRVDLLPPEGRFTAAALAECWPAGAGRVAIPGSALSSPTLADGLRAKGYDVQAIAVYTVEPVPQLPAAVAEDLAAGAFDVVTVLSGSMGRALAERAQWPQPTRLVAFGPATAAALAEQGQAVAAVAQTQDAAGLIAAVAQAGRQHS